MSMFNEFLHGHDLKKLHDQAMYHGMSPDEMQALVINLAGQLAELQKKHTELESAFSQMCEHYSLI